MSNQGRFINAIFCDDIRHEVGNKLSFMGCYQGNVFLNELPAVLPKLAVQVSVSTPKDRPFQNLAITVLRDDSQVIGNLDIPVGDSGAMIAEALADETASRLQFTAIFMFAPFMVEANMMIRVKATTEEGEIIGPRITIGVPDSAGGQAGAPIYI